MINPAIPAPDALDWESIDSGSIDLSLEQIEQAIQRSEAILDPDQQWRVYLHWLALASFEQWMAERAPDLRLNLDHCSIQQPQYASLIDSVCNLQVGDFRVCLIATGSLADTIVRMSRAIVDHPAFVAHVYVLVEVLEEQEQARVYGYIRYDQLTRHLQSTAQVADASHAYSLPVNWFVLDANQLLLNLRCVDAGTINPPISNLADSISVEQLQAKLAEICSQNRSLTDLQTALNWNEMITLLNHPELLSSTAQRQLPDRDHQEEETSIRSLSQRAINVALWLRGQLDQLAQELDWVWVPAPTLAPVALRSSIEGLDGIEEELRLNGVGIPATAGRAYWDVQWDDMALRVYAITWELAEHPAEPEWVLLVILGPQPGTSLPNGVTLHLRDDSQLLAEQVLTNSSSLYLYTQVVGSLNESFFVAIGSSDRTMLTLPPFTFQPR